MTDKVTAFSYWFVHFSVEVLCFFVLETIYPEFSVFRWIAVLTFDLVAFMTQPIVGIFFESHQKLRPGLIGGGMLILGSGAVSARLVLSFRSFISLGRFINES